MFAFLRQPLPPKLNRADQNPIYYENGTSALEFLENPEDYLLRNTHPPYNKDDPSIMNPPFHYHINQTEHFRIVSGECHLFKDTKSASWKTLSAKEPAGLRTASIPNQIYHTLQNVSSTEPLVLDVSLTPENYEGEQRFFRNFFGYLDDCKRVGQKPSLFQLMVFLRSSDTPLGLPMPSKTVGVFASRIFMNFMAFVGERLLGYDSTYDEYYVERKRV